MPDLGQAHCIQGNALKLPLPDASVDLICTSPPDYLSIPNGYDSKGRWGLKGQPEDTPLPTRLGDGSQVTITGYVCGCPTPDAPTRPSAILDPFGGTGTTALVAKVLGRTGISIDLSADYCRLAEWRCNDPRQLATALQVEKPDVIPDGQLSLFEEAT